METIKHILLINAYWFSLPLIGFFVLSMAQKYLKDSRVRAIIRLTKRQHVFTAFLISFAVSVFLFSVTSLIFYLLNAPAFLLTLVYVVLLLLSALYAGIEVMKRLFQRNDLRIFLPAKQTLAIKLLFALFLIFLVVDFLVSLDVKSYALVSADTYVHLSRIVSILSQGFTIQSGFFGGLPEAGYHYNVVYALYAAGSQATHTQPFEMWRYSFGFFRLLQWLAIFTLAHYVLRSWLQWKKVALAGAVLTTLFAIAVYTPYFYTAIYPNQIVTIWLILLIIGISLYERGVKGIEYCLAALALITTMTHPTYAFMAAIFIGMFLCVRLIIERKEFIKQKSKLLTYGVIAFILMLGPLRTKTFPNRMNAQQADVGGFATLKVFGLSMKQPTDILPVNATSAVIWILSLIAVIYLLIHFWKRSKRLFALILTLVLFYPIIVYVPPVFTILHTALPLWVIERFTAMDILVYILAFIGLYLLAMFLWSIGRKTKGLPAWLSNIFNRQKAMYVFIAVATLVLTFRMLPFSYHQLETIKDGNEHYYSFMTHTYEDFNTVLNGEKTVVANQGDSYFLASIFPIDVLAIEAGHMSPVASADNRIACQAHILQTFEYGDLKNVKASFVVIAKYDKSYSDEKKTADSKSYLQFVGQDNNFDIYKVLDSTPHSASSSDYKPCIQYQQIERG